MAELHYTTSTLHHQEGLPGLSQLSDVPRSSLATATSDYPSHPSYSAASSFASSLPCDPDLLTPISSGSPTLDHDQKLMRPYQFGSGTSQVQQPSPPGTARMFPPWPQQFGVPPNVTEGASTMNPSQTEAAQNFLNPYSMHDERDPPLPPSYMGHFTVSSGGEPHPIQSPYYLDANQHMDQHNALMIRDGSSMQVDGHDERSVLSSTPLLHHPQPSHQRPNGHVTTAMTNSTAGSPATQDYNEPSRSMSVSPTRRTGSIKVTKSRRPSRRQTVSRKKAPLTTDPMDEHRNCFGDENPPPLSDSTNAEQRCVFEARWKHRHQRGHNMWEYIQNDVEKTMNRSYSKETLQMIFSRGRPECYEWLPKDEDILRQAWIKMERERYRQLRDLFLEMGGSRNMCLSPWDVEIKVVNDLKLEQNVYIDGIKEVPVRRRQHARQPGCKKRSAKGQGTEDAEVPASNDMSSHNDPDETAADVINQVRSRRDLETNGEEIQERHWVNQTPMKMRVQGANEGPVSNPRGQQTRVELHQSQKPQRKKLAR